LLQAIEAVSDAGGKASQLPEQSEFWLARLQALRTHSLEQTRSSSVPLSFAKPKKLHKIPSPAKLFLLAGLGILNILRPLPKSSDRNRQIAPPLASYGLTKNARLTDG